MKLNTHTFFASRFTRVFFGVDEAYEQILKSIGVDDANITALKGVTPETLKDFKPEDMVTAINTSLVTRFQNDPDFLKTLTVEKLPSDLKKSIENGQYGRFMNEFKEFVQKTQGVDISDLSEEDQKSLKKVAAAAFTKYGAKKGDPATLTELQNKFQKALEEVETTKGSIDTKVKEAVEAEKTNSRSLLQKLLVQTHLDGIEGLKVKGSFIADTILQKLASKYSLQLEGTDIVIRQKENSALKVLNGSKEVTFSEALTELVTAENLIEKKADPGNGGAGGEKGEGTVVKVGVEGSEVKLPDNIANKINNNLKTEAAGSKA